MTDPSATASSVTLDDALRRLRAGEVDVDAATVASLIRADTSGAALAELVSSVEPRLAAPVLAAVVRAGADDPETVQTALAVGAVAGDAVAVASIRHAARQLPPELLLLLKTHARDAGAEPVSAVLAGLASAPEPPSSPRVVRVLGMHRASTSLVAQVLRVFGCDPGPEDELIPPAADNPRGFHEHRPLVLASERMLTRLGGAWDAPPDEFRPSDDRLAVAVPPAIATLDRFLGMTSGLALWKDPRLCITLPVWDLLLPAAADIRDLHVVRPPDEVIGSLSRRNGMHTEHAARLWVRHVRGVISSSPDAPVMDARELFESPDDAVARIAAAVGLAPSSDELAQATAVVDPALQRRGGRVQDGPWVSVARALHGAVLASDLDRVRSIGDPVEVRVVTRPTGVPLALPTEDAQLSQLGAPVAPAALRLPFDNPRARYAASSLGWSPVAGSVHDVCRRVRPTAVWAGDDRTVGQVVLTLVGVAPKTPLSAPAPVVVADQEVPVGAATAWLADPPAIVTGEPAVSPVAPVAQREGVVSVVIPVHGKWSLTDRCLTTLRATTDPDRVEVIVVDDASPDGTRAKLDCDPRVDVVVALDQNLGFPAAVNAGVAASRGSHVCVLNNDTELQPGWLAAMMRELGRPGVALVGPRSNHISGPQQVPGAPRIGPGGVDGTAWAEEYLASAAASSWPIDRLVGFCMLMRRSLLEAIGAFDQGVGMGNYEDDELCARASWHGSLRVVDDSLVLHVGSATFGGGDAWHRAMLVGARHTSDRLANRVVSIGGVVFTDGVSDAAMRSVDSLAALLVPAVIIDRACIEAGWADSERGSRVRVQPLSWIEACGEWGKVCQPEARSVIVLEAGEVIGAEDLAAARAGLEGVDRAALVGAEGARVVSAATSTRLDPLVALDADDLPVVETVRVVRPTGLSTP